MFDRTKFVPVGLFEESPYKEFSIQLEAGDKLFLYTDGVSEAENVNNVLFGEDSLMKILNENRTGSPRELVQRMEEAVSLHVAGYIQSDDITMMTIAYNE